MVQAEQEHDNLVDELTVLENFSPEERLSHAKHRREEQLARYNSRLKHQQNSDPITQASHDKNIRFDKNIELIEAAARNDAEEVAMMMRNGITPNLQNDDGLSALHQAVIEDCADVVSTLITHGADLNIKDADLWTPMHAAVACGNYDLVKYLTESGASLVEINTDGNMPIDLVEDNEDIEIFLDDAMVKAGYTEDDLEAIRNETANIMLDDLKEYVADNRDLDVIGEQGETAMHIAAANGYEEVVEYLLDHGAKIDVVDHDCWQPIHAAACWGQDKIIEILVNHGADLDAVTADGEMPIDLTEDEELQYMIIELKESGHKTKEVKRSQSNSSRTMSHSWIPQGKPKSKYNSKSVTGCDGQQEKGVFQGVDINLQDDSEDEDHKSEKQTSTTTPQPSVTPTSPAISDEKLELQPPIAQADISFTTTPTEKTGEERIAVVDNTEKINKHTHDKDNNVTKSQDVKIELQPLDTDTRVNTNQTQQSKQQYTKVDIDLEAGENTQQQNSHNTAKSHKNKTLTQSTDMAVKKKCCIIL